MKHSIQKLLILFFFYGLTVEAQTYNKYNDTKQLICRFEEKVIEVNSLTNDEAEFQLTDEKSHLLTYGKFKIVQLGSLYFDLYRLDSSSYTFHINVLKNKPITETAYESILTLEKDSTEFVQSCWDGCDNTLQYPSKETVSETKGVCRFEK